MRISIHAPPRGATRRAAATSGDDDHFNSRPSARGDLIARCAARRTRYFNSRPSARGDTPPKGAAARNCPISIHAPPRGATLWLSDNVCPANFNSRPSARGDRLIARCAARRTHFNSRPSARGDRAAERRRLHPRISIHAPPRGATITRREAIQLCRISIHAPPRGATRVVFLSFVAFHFNSRPSARGDISFLDGVVNYDISIHAPPRGATAAQRCGGRP